MVDANPFGNLLSGYMTGRDRQQEEAIRMAQDAFRQSQANYQQFDDNRKFEYAQKQDALQIADRQTERLISSRKFDDSLAFDRERLASQDKRDESNRTSRETLGKLKSESMAKIAAMKNISADERFALGKAIEFTDDLDTAKLLYGQMTGMLGQEQTPQQGVIQAQGIPFPSSAPQGVMSAPSGMDLMGMLNGLGGLTQESMPQGAAPQGMRPPQIGNMEFGGRAGAQRDIMNSRAALNNQAIGMNKQKAQLEIRKFNLSEREKNAVIKRIQTQTPVQIQKTIQEIAESKSRVAARTAEIKRAKVNDVFDNSYTQARTDKLKNPDAEKQWGIKNRLPLEQRKSAAQQEWRQNEKMVQDLQQQQRALTYMTTVEEMNPQDKASYDSLQESIEQSSAMRDAAKSDYAMYQQMAKNVGIYDPKSPEGLAERGRSNYRDNIPREKPAPPRRGYITPAAGSPRDKKAKAAAAAVNSVVKKTAPPTGKKDYSKMTTDQLKREYMNRMR